METIPEYLALYKSDATTDGNKYTWNILQSYYSNSRGSVCYVSLVQCLMTSPNNNEVIIKIQSGQNEITTDKQASVLALLAMNESVAGGGHLSLNSSEPIKLLINSRPKTITLQTNNLDNTAYNLGNNDAVFILKFEYLPLKQEQENFIEQQYPKL
jgi:hypothetical protein